MAKTGSPAFGAPGSQFPEGERRRLLRMRVEDRSVHKGDLEADIIQAEGTGEDVEDFFIRLVNTRDTKGAPVKGMFSGVLLSVELNTTVRELHDFYYAQFNNKTEGA